MKNITVFFLVVTFFGSLGFSQTKLPKEEELFFNQTKSFFLLDYYDDMQKIFVLPVCIGMDLEKLGSITNRIDSKTRHVCVKFAKKGEVRLYHFSVPNSDFSYTCISNGVDSLAIGPEGFSSFQGDSISLFSMSLYRKTVGVNTFSKSGEIIFQHKMGNLKEDVFIRTKLHTEKNGCQNWIANRIGSCEVVPSVLALVEDYIKAFGIPE